MLEIIIVILWGGVGGFDWLFDCWYCLFNIEYNYLETIAKLETELQHLKDINEGLLLEIKDLKDENNESSI